MHHVLKTLSTHIVKRGTYSKAVCGSDFGYAVCPVLWRDTLHVEYTLSLYVADGHGFFGTHIVAGDVTVRILMLILWGMYS
jgi:hypothetical protein